MSDKTTDIRFERRGRLGIAVLDRPAALNALSREMVQALSLRLVAWRDDPEIDAVLVKAVPGRAFCAGGDVRVVTDLARERGIAAATPFFRDEYRLNWRIHTFPKPYIALLDGITMGGGVGISVHGRYRVVTENTLFAMPETGIGFFPDVGGTWFLPRCPGEVGMYLGLTGARLNGADSRVAGVGTHAVPADRLMALEERLAERLRGGADAHAIVAAVLEEHTGDIGAPSLPAVRARIDACFGGASVAEILERLREEPSGFGAEQLGILAGKSPFAVHVTCAQLRRGRDLSIEDCLRLEYRMVHRMLEAGDFIEGVRALLVDKDKRPRWRHRSLEDVPADEVEAVFAPLPAGELALDWQGI
ncbi:enoyl-CoA hydratase/isomerase family protein [Benzoatithermus flavus]|uniref:3-hydroxyisobutyryl-CoA hydrolase n=1 Tax=Benzoatithermus flavus TaxID=3108223 RepID=A0ABU8XP17_9PROT